MIKVSITGMVVSLKTDLRFPIPGQQGHEGRIIHLVDLHIFFMIQGTCKPVVSNIPTEKQIV